MRIRSLAVGLLLSVVLSGPATADEAAATAAKEAPTAEAALPDVSQSTLGPERFIKALGVVPFGKDIAALTAYRAERLAEQYRTRILGTPDVRQRDLLEAEQKEKLEEFEKSHVEFRGQRTGYDISILSGEFRHNARQSMRLVVEDDAIVHFLLTEGMLWKVIYQMPAEGKSFADLLARARATYGEPLSLRMRTVYREGEPVESPEEATWEDGGLRFVLHDQATLYRAHVAKWELIDVEARVAGGTPARGTPGDRFRAEDALREVMTPDDTDVEDIVDRLLEGDD